MSWRIPYIGPKLAEALRGARSARYDRIKIFRQISERFLTEWGNPPRDVRKFSTARRSTSSTLLTMQRTEYQGRRLRSPNWRARCWASARIRQNSASGPQERREKRSALRQRALPA